MIKTARANVKDALMSVIDELSADHIAKVLEFALLIKSRQAQQPPDASVQPVQQLEDLWGDFWPEDESVDAFIDAVRHWRRQDVALHKDLPWA